MKNNFLIQNLFEENFLNNKEEFFENLGRGTNFKIERIVSTGQISPNEFWYDQDQDEMVFLLEGNSVLSIKDENDAQTKIDLKKGDYLLIKAHIKHRIDFTSINPPCIWLAIHGDFK